MIGWILLGVSWGWAQTTEAQVTVGDVLEVVAHGEAAQAQALDITDDPACWVLIERRERSDGSTLFRLVAGLPGEGEIRARGHEDVLAVYTIDSTMPSGTLAQVQGYRSWPEEKPSDVQAWVALVLLSVFGVFWYWRARATPAVDSPNRLTWPTLPKEAGDVRRFYDELMRLCRGRLSSLWGSWVRSSTNVEMAARLEDPRWHKTLEAVDRGRFARTAPDPETREEDMEAARALLVDGEESR